jgi:hypothetical protein
MDGRRDFGQPFLSLFFCARNDDIKHAPMDFRNATETENAIPPYGFERVAENGLLSGCLSIRGVENDRAVGLEKTSGNAFARLSFHKFVGDSRSDYPVNPSFQYCRWLPPPIRMNDDNTISQKYLLTVPLDFWWQKCIARELVEREYRIEMLVVQVVRNDLVAIFN